MADHEATQSHDEQKEIVYEEGPWTKYLWGANAAKLLHGHFYKVNPIFGVYYLT